MPSQTTEVAAKRQRYFNIVLFGSVVCYAWFFNAMIRTAEEWRWPETHPDQQLPDDVNSLLATSLMNGFLLSKYFFMTPADDGFSLVEQVGSMKQHVLKDMIVTAVAMEATALVSEKLFSENMNLNYACLYAMLTSVMLVGATGKIPLSRKSQLMALSFLFNVGMKVAEPYGYFATIPYLVVGAIGLSRIFNKLYEKETNSALSNHSDLVSDVNRSIFINTMLLTALFVGIYSLDLVNAKPHYNTGALHLYLAISMNERKAESFKQLVHSPYFYMLQSLVLLTFMGIHHASVSRWARYLPTELITNQANIPTSGILREQVFREAKRAMVLTWLATVLVHLTSKVHQEDCVGEDVLLWSMMFGIFARGMLGFAQGLTHLGLTGYLCALGPSIYCIFPYGPRNIWTFSATWGIGATLFSHLLRLHEETNLLPALGDQSIEAGNAPDLESEQHQVAQSCIKKTDQIIQIGSAGMLGFSLYNLIVNDLLCTAPSDDEIRRNHYFLLGALASIGIIALTYHMMQRAWPKKQPQEAQPKTHPFSWFYEKRQLSVESTLQPVSAVPGMN